MNGSLKIRSALAPLAAYLVVAAFGSCSASNTDNSYKNTGANNGAGGANFSGSGGNSLIDANTSDSLDESGACVAEKYDGKVVPFDIYVLLDATASMNGANDTPVVWPSVTSALNALISDSESEGIGVGLTFLPVKPPAGFHVPGSCSTDADCPGATGPCKALSIGIPKTCTNACTAATVEQDCGLYGECMLMLQYKICNGAMVPNVSCDPADYGQPVVEIGTLPGNKDALVAAINGKDPDGDATPTEPSLRGALAHAQAWANDNPSHLVNVLFATDGLPNDCTFNSIDGAAAAAKEAFEASPSVPTFVLGIGELSDLNAIATAGGTTQAYIADSSSVAQKLLDVMNEIRLNGACKFQIPKPAKGELNYDAVNVSYVPLGETTSVDVYYVGSVDKCDPVKGGWYYDVDPKQGTPGKILLCPATCAEVKKSIEGVNVLLGCKTKVY